MSFNSVNNNNNINNGSNSSGKNRSVKGRVKGSVKGSVNGDNKSMSSRQSNYKNMPTDQMRSMSSMMIMGKTLSYQQYLQKNGIILNILKITFSFHFNLSER